MCPPADISQIVHSGLVIENTDWAEVAKALHELSSDMPKALKLQQAALKIRQSDYTVSDMIAEYEKVLHEVTTEVTTSSWSRPQPFVWSRSFGDALPPQNVIYPEDALR
jgi:hypothetical protein